MGQNIIDSTNDCDKNCELQVGISHNNCYTECLQCGGCYIKTELLKECERYVYDAVSDEDSYVIDMGKAIEIVKGVVKE